MGWSPGEKGKKKEKKEEGKTKKLMEPNTLLHYITAAKKGKGRRNLRHDRR